VTCNPTPLGGKLVALLLIGLNHKTTPVELRENFYLNHDQLYAALTRLKHGSANIREVAILSTCNRFEVYAIARNGDHAEQEIMEYLTQYYDQEENNLRVFMYIARNRPAVRHLMCVSAGLDSMILGEAQILGQVGQALECATHVSTSGTFLHRMFEQAVRAGKRARTETEISQHTTSVSHAAAILVANQMNNPEAHVVICGAGEMAEMAAKALTKVGMTNLHFINRTLDNAQLLADGYAGIAYDWSQMWDQLKQADVVIGATGAPHIIIYKNDVQQVLDERDGKPLVLVDIAVPRNIEATIDALDNVTLFDIDDMQKVVDNSLAQREACIPEVRQIIAEEEDKYWTWLNERNVVPVIKDLRREVQMMVDAELEEALNKLGELDEQGQAVVQRMAHRIMNKLLHTPTAQLRAQAANGNAEDYANLVRDLFDLVQIEIEQEQEAEEIRQHA
jgi:glutamyl-tRNA reductase